MKPPNYPMSPPFSSAVYLGLLIQTRRQGQTSDHPARCSLLGMQVQVDGSVGDDADVKTKRQKIRSNRARF